MSGPAKKGWPGRAPIGGAEADARAPHKGRGYSYSYVWLVTFTDLVALMLTFFVLLFAMSRVEHEKWQSLVRALTDASDAVREEEAAKPALEFQIEQARVLPGADLDYLAPVLREQVAADPTLAGTLVRHLPDRLVISLPGRLLYAPGSTVLAPKGARAVFAIGGILRNLGNVVEVEAYAEPGRGRAGRSALWEATLLRAASLTRMLAEAGYDGPVLARGFGSSGRRDRGADSGAGPPASLAGRIDVVIHERAREHG